MDYQQQHLQNISTHDVKVDRTVIGKYGVVEYIIRFVKNEGQIPPGAGDVPILNVTQANATNNVFLQKVHTISEITPIAGKIII